MMLMLAWVPASAHCLLEGMVERAEYVCGQNCSHENPVPVEHGNCGDLEDGFYKAVANPVFAAAAEILSDYSAVLLRMMLSHPPRQTKPDWIGSPPFLGASFIQTVVCTVAPVRGPAFLA